MLEAKVLSGREVETASIAIPSHKLVAVRQRPARFRHNDHVLHPHSPGFDKRHLCI